jgi:hypothetical protein
MSVLIGMASSSSVMDFAGTRFVEPGASERADASDLGCTRALHNDLHIGGASGGSIDSSTSKEDV